MSLARLESLESVISDAICPKCKKVRTRCKCTSNIQTVAEESTKRVTNKRNKNSSYVERLLEVIRERKAIDRKELTKFGFSSGGTLTRALRKLEKEGYIRLETENLCGSVKRTKIIYVGKT